MSQTRQRRPPGQGKGAATETRHPTTLLEPEQLIALARQLAPLVAAEIAARLAGAERPATYSTRRGHHPTGYSAEAWRALAPTIGVRRGRWYVVTRDALDAHERRQAEPATPEPTAAARSWSPADAAEQSGLRLVGGGR